jgi:hypothetical protein
LRSVLSQLADWIKEEECRTCRNTARLSDAQVAIITRRTCRQTRAIASATAGRRRTLWLLQGRCRSTGQASGSDDLPIRPLRRLNSATGPTTKPNPALHPPCVQSLNLPLRHVLTVAALLTPAFLHFPLISWPAKLQRMGLVCRNAGYIYWRYLGQCSTCVTER